MVFSRSKIIPLINLKLGGKTINFKNVHTFLGLAFDSRFSRKHRVENIYINCIKRQNLLRTVVGQLTTI